MPKLGETIRAVDYVHATHEAHTIAVAMAEFHRHYDVLLTPTMATPPVKLGWLDMMMRDVDTYWDRVAAFAPLCVPFNITGQPGISLPVGQSANGLPIGVQAVAPYGDDITLLQLAAQLEQCSLWRGGQVATDDLA